MQDGKLTSLADVKELDLFAKFVILVAQLKMIGQSQRESQEIAHEVIYVRPIR